MSNMTKHFSWVGSEESFVDKPSVIQLDHIEVGRYGGNSDAGQYKNEDGCLIWLNSEEDWEFTMILDAHNSAESAELVLAYLNKEKSHIETILSLPTNESFKSLEDKIVGLFQSKEFLAACKNVTGETACLIVARKDRYIWWFSVGDCVLYLFHTELAALGQLQVNQRHFYEWIGQVNTFERPVSCYTIGTKELRKGDNHLFLTTDGLIECPNEPYSNPADIYETLLKEESTESLLKGIQHNNVRDSTTMVSWKVTISKEATKASNQ